MHPCYFIVVCMAAIHAACNGKLRKNLYSSPFSFILAIMVAFFDATSVLGRPGSIALMGDSCLISFVRTSV
jgi:hypothetical protein